MKAQYSSTDFSFREIMLVSLLGIIGVIAWGVYSGQDLGPDLVNYHFYSGYLAFHKERLLSDIFPAGIQGYLNPYLYALPYLLYKILPPIGVGIILGALHGLCFISVYIVSRLLLANWPERLSRLMAFACAVFGVINPFFLAMIGSTFSDNLTPPLILIPLAFILMVRLPSPTWLPSARQYYLALFVSGIMIGMTVGFKLSNCAFVLGLLAAWFVNFRFSKRDIWGGISLFGAVGVGFLLVNGEWMWRLYSEFHSPLFPFYNHIFKSTMVKEIDTNVPAWAAAHSFYDFLVYPYRWVVGIPPQSEWDFSDSRFAMIYTLLVGLLIFRFFPTLTRTINRLFNRQFNPISSNQYPAYILSRYWFIGIWSMVSYLFWIDQFGALRYLMPVTLLTGLLMLICIINLISYRNLAIGLWIILAVTSLATMHPPYFGRVEWKKSWYPVKVPKQLLSSKNTLYLKNSLSFIIPFFPNDAQFIDIGYLVLDGNLIDKAHQIIASHQGPIRTLTLMPILGTSFYDQLKKNGLMADPRNCVTFKGGVYPFQSCLVEHMSKNPQPFVVPLLTELTFTEPQSPWIKTVTGFYAQEPDGIWTQGDTAEIYLFGVLSRKFKLQIRAAHFIGENSKLPFKVIIDKQERVFSFAEGVMTAEVFFRLNTSNANKIVIKIPKPISPHTLDPANADKRELGMMLHSVTIEPENFTKIDLRKFDGGKQWKLSGFSTQEQNGRWTEGRNASIDLGETVSSRVTLTLNASAFGPNIGQPIKLVLGKKTATIRLSDKLQNVSVTMDIGKEKARVLKINIPTPTSPADLKQSADTRKLGIFIEQVQIS